MFAMMSPDPDPDDEARTRTRWVGIRGCVPLSGRERGEEVFLLLMTRSSGVMIREPYQVDDDDDVVDG